MEWAPDSRDAANNVGTVNRATLPSVCGQHDCGNPNVRDGVTILGGNCDGFIGETKEPLDADGLVISFCGGGKTDIKEVTHFLKDGKEFIVCINVDHVAEADLKENVLHKSNGEVRGENGYKGDDNGEPC